MKYITFTVPCYNSAAYMRKCIDSLLVAGEDAEIIVVNDGSKDDTGKIADTVAIGVAIASGIDLINNGLLPPLVCLGQGDRREQCVAGVGGELLYVPAGFDGQRIVVLRVRCQQEAALEGGLFGQQLLETRRQLLCRIADVKPGPANRC